jgi:hypothetical protein
LKDFFEKVIEKELPSIKGALEILGYTNDSVKIAIVICQKGHHTRFVYEEVVSGQPVNFINPCPGLVLDATAKGKSITNASINEFYLNSHAAIQVIFNNLIHFWVVNR